MSFSKVIGAITSINECVSLFQWVKSAISSLHLQRSSTQGQKLLDEVPRLESGLQCLRETLPAMYDLIDRAEWRSHDLRIAELLPALTDAVHDADDLLDEFKWYELKMAVEDNVSQAPSVDFLSVVDGSFNKVDAIQTRLNNLSSQLEKMGLREVSQTFDRSVRPETSSFPMEKKLFGRKKELKNVIALLVLPMNRSKTCTKRKRTSNAAIASTGNQVSLPNSNKPRIASVPVLPIVGIGGVGKTTLAQHICSHPKVTSHFKKIIWICVSDDFDVKRLTREAILSASGKEVTSDNLDYLQRALADELKNEKFLLVLDDMWEDALKENGQCWQRFCAPLSNILEGSMLLVTTRSPNVADRVGTMDSFPLEGLTDNVYWDFFKLCVFGSEAPNIDPELEKIGRSIVPKLKGSPLAAKTLGQLLGMRVHATHWNSILHSELWELKQEETDILPALRLSYIYLPFHLKRCFSFCAVYPKDHRFKKASLAELWVAEGFVVPQGNIPLQDIASQYFEDLVDRSFFQIVRGRYVIHDLMHDMAQLVSKDECFIIKNTTDFQRVPKNVRHLTILANSDLKSSDLLSLCKHTKLRTLFCNKSLRNKNSLYVMERWCNELRCMRVIFCVSVRALPESIGNMKHLRYLEISKYCPLKSPWGFCCLYNLHTVYVRKCELESLPANFWKLINLQIFESRTLQYSKGQKLEVDATAVEGKTSQISLIQNMNQFLGDMIIYNIGATSKNHAAEAKLDRKKYLNNLTLMWYSSTYPDHNEIEVFEALHPPTNLKSFHLMGYPGEYLPSWFRDCDRINRIPLSTSECTNFNEIPAVIDGNYNGRIGSIFSLLTEITIEGCENLLTLEQFLQPDFVPVIKKLRIEKCK